MLGWENRKDSPTGADVVGRFIAIDYPRNGKVYGYAIRTDEPKQGETKNSAMITIDITTLKGQQIASKFLYEGWQIVTFQTNFITLQSPSYAQKN